jgi:hypothetical protein
MPLAPQVGNPGSRGQDSRYKFDPSYMYVGPDGRITDGTYHYSGDEAAMLSDDRPSVPVPGVPPADDSHSMYAFSAQLRPGQAPGSPTTTQPAAPPPPPEREFVPMPRPGMGGRMPEGFQYFDIGRHTWDDPNYGAQNKAQYQKTLEGLFDVIRKNNPGLYKDRAAFLKDTNAIMAGKPNTAPPPTVRGNPYGSLAPSPSTVRRVDDQRVVPFAPLPGTAGGRVQTPPARPAGRGLPVPTVPFRPAKTSRPILSTAGTRAPILPKPAPAPKKKK